MEWFLDCWLKCAYHIIMVFSLVIVKYPTHWILASCFVLAHRSWYQSPQSQRHIITQFNPGQSSRSLQPSTLQLVYRSQPQLHAEESCLDRAEAVYVVAQLCLQ